MARPYEAPAPTIYQRRLSRVRFDAEQASQEPALQQPGRQREGSNPQAVVSLPRRPLTAQPHYREDPPHFSDWEHNAPKVAAGPRETLPPPDTIFATSNPFADTAGNSHLPYRQVPFQEAAHFSQSPNGPLVSALRRNEDVSESRRDSDATLTDVEINRSIGAGEAIKGDKARTDTSCACKEVPDVAARKVLKSAMRRRAPEEDPSVMAAEEAASLVDSHVDSGRTHHRSQSARHPYGMIDRRQYEADNRQTDSRPHPFDWAADDEEAPAVDARQPKPGVLSNLLKLTSTDLDRSATASSVASATSVVTSRNPSQESHNGQGLRQRRRRASDISVTSVYPMGDEKTKQERPSLARRGSSVATCNAANDEKGGEEVLGPLKRKRHSSRKLRRLSITVHVADVLLRHKFILKLAKALMTFGAPSHRIESQLNAIADILDVDGHFIHLPSVVIASFGDPDTHTTETHFVKAGGGLNLGSLTEVHEVYRQVAHDEMGVDLGLQHLTRLLNAKPVYGLWTRVLIAIICAGSICMLGFSGSLIDGLVSSVFGGILAFLQIRVAASNPMYSNIFEISMATLVSFVGRGLATTNLFCYEAISSSGVVLILPGYVILCGSLELASRNLIAGSVKLVYSIIYSLFLGFGIAIGSDVYYLFDKRAKSQGTVATPAESAFLSALGVLSFVNSTLPSLNGTFALSNATAGIAVVNVHDEALKAGNVICMRDASWQWWRQEVNPWWAFLLVPLFSAALSLWNLQPVKDRQFPVMIVIAVIGYATNRLANMYIFNRSDVVSFIGSFVIGICGNLYSRIYKGTAFTAMVTGVLFLVPSGIAAAGGLAITDKSGTSDSYSNGLLIGFRMIQVAIGITVGLFFASFLIYSFFSGRKRSSALFAF